MKEYLLFQWYQSFFAEQPNKFYKLSFLCCAEWEIGMEIDNNVKRNGSGGVSVRELMDGEKG